VDPRSQSVRPMEDVDTLKKRLLYLSQHRGMQELDCLLGGFAQNYIESMDDETLKQFEDLLSFSDQDLYGAFFEKKPIHQSSSQSLIIAIQNDQKNGGLKIMLSSTT